MAEDAPDYLASYLTLQATTQDSIRDNATLPLHFEALDVRLHIDKDAINEAYAEMTGSLNEQDRDDLAKQVAACLAFFPNIDRTIGGYKGLMAAQDCLAGKASIPANGKCKKPCVK